MKPVDLWSFILWSQSTCDASRFNAMLRFQGNSGASGRHINGITWCPFLKVTQRSITFKAYLSCFDMLAMALHCVSAKSVFHKECSCSCNESSCMRMKFTCTASLVVLEAGPINDHPNGSWLFCFSTNLLDLDFEVLLMVLIVILLSHPFKSSSWVRRYLYNGSPEPEKNALTTVSLPFAWTLIGIIHIKTAWVAWAAKHAPEALSFSEG